MNNLKYFIQFLAISFLFIIYKFLGLKYSTILSGKILMFLGPLFRSNKICYKNLSTAFPDINEIQKNYCIYFSLW